MASRNFLVYMLLLVAALHQSRVHGRRNFYMCLDYCNCTASPIYTEPCVCKIDKSLKPPTGLLDVQLHHELYDARFSFEVVLIKKNNEEYILFNSTDNKACALLNPDSRTGLTMIQIFKDILLSAGKLPEKCPIDKDFHFQFKEFSVDVDKFPPYVPEARFAVRVIFTEVKNHIMTVEIYGDIIQRSKKVWG